MEDVLGRKARTPVHRGAAFESETTAGAFRRLNSPKGGSGEEGVGERRVPSQVKLLDAEQFGAGGEIAATDR